MSDLRRKLELKVDPENGLVLELDDWNHRDYIEDVLAEHFDIEYEYLVEDEKSDKHTLYFFDSVEQSVLEKAIEVINKYHASSKELFEVI